MGQPVKELFSVKCSSALATALGATPFVRVPRPYSFPVYESRDTHHAELLTEDGPYAWLWTMDGIDGSHFSIDRL